jgi:hypothetical protein
MSASNFHYPSESEAAETQFHATRLSDVMKTLDVLADSIRRATKAIYLLCQQLIIWLTVLLISFSVLTRPVFLRGLKIDRNFSLQSGYTFIIAIIASVAFWVSISLIWRIGIIYRIMQRARGFRRELVHIIARSSTEGQGNEYF